MEYKLISHASDCPAECYLTLSHVQHQYHVYIIIVCIVTLLTVLDHLIGNSSVVGLMKLLFRFGLSGIYDTSTERAYTRVTPKN